MHSTGQLMVATGGDGVIALALQELAGGRVPLAIVPAGTGSDRPRVRHPRPPGPRPTCCSTAVPDRRSRHRRGRRQSASGSAPWCGSGFCCCCCCWPTHWSVTARTGCAGRAGGCALQRVAMIAELSRLLPVPLSFDDGPTEDVQLTMTAIGKYPQLRRRDADARRPTPPTDCSTSR